MTPSILLDFLIIDDDQIFSTTLVRALTRRGFESATATTSTAALSLLNTTSFTYAIVDLKLEKESGLHLIRELKTRCPLLEIIMLTGYSSISTAVDAIKYGATNYLCKPADVEDILAAFNLENEDLSIDVDYTPLSIERLEWEHIQRHLQENDGNISATARALGMHRRTLQRKLQKRPVKN
jgi:two-component system, response regulator RegA